MENPVVLTSFVNEMDAQLVVLELQASGIEAFIRKDDCGGMHPLVNAGRGAEVLIQAQDLEQARQVLNDQPGLKPAAEPTSEPTRKGSGCASLLFVLCFGLAAGFLGAHAINYTDTGRLKLVGWKDAFDRNGDGVVDIEWQYDKTNLYIGGRSDDNFDGAWDVWWIVEKGLLVENKHDLDFNGKIDSITSFKHGVATHVDHKPNGSGIIVRREIYRDGVFHQELIDTDRDGAFDVETTYDPFLNETGSREL